MTRILLTAFEPYEPWKSNASWLALVQLTKNLPAELQVTTRLYPVDLDVMKRRISADLQSRYDVILNVGQAPCSSCIQLEEIALNVASGGKSLADKESTVPICESGPAAYVAQLPIRDFASQLRAAGIPARVSHHAGTYLCNAIFYWTCRLIDDLHLDTQCALVHVPLDTSQVLELDSPAPFMPSSMVAEGLKLLMRLATYEESPAIS